MAAFFTKLVHLLDMPKLVEDSNGFATRILERWDVPHEIDGKSVADDIDDRTPRWWRTRDGHRLTGLTSPNEIVSLGVPSVATPAVIGLIPLIGIGTMLLFLLLGPLGFFIGGALLAPVAYALMIGEGREVATECVLFGAVVPIAGACVSQSSLLPEVMAKLQAFPFAAPIALLLILAFVASVTKSIDKARVALLYIVTFSAVLCLSMRILAHWMQPIPWFLGAALMPWIWARHDWNHHIDRQNALDQAAPAESTQSSGEGHMGARLDQAKAVAADKSPVLTMAIATGTLTQRKDGFSPDRGKPLCMSVEDMTMHHSIIGTTGTRKTSFIRAIIAQWVRLQCGGMLVLDIKDLPGELRGLISYTLIEPGVRFACLEGLNPTETTEAIFGAGHGDSKSNSSSAKFFETSAKTLWLNASVVVEALIAQERVNLNQMVTNGELVASDVESSRRFKWTVSCIRTVVAHGIRDDKAMEKMLSYLTGFKSPSEGEQHMLEAAVDYFKVTVPAMDSETRSNVFATLVTWIDPIVSHKSLVAFAHIEHSEGFDLCDILKGGKFGVNLPYNSYGAGGAVISNLAKQRFYKLMNERASRDWRALGEKHVLLVVDEASSLVGSADAHFLSVARGYGACCIFAVQSADMYVTSLGSEPATQAFLNNFRSKTTMESTDYSYKIMSQTLGTTRKPQWSGSNVGVNFAAELKRLGESILMDPKHPGAGRLAVLMQRGAGMFREGAGGQGFMGHKHYAHDHSKVDGVTKTSILQQVSWSEAPLMELSDFDAKLAERGVAVMQVMRGGVRRRDVVRFESLQAFPADLLVHQAAPTNFDQALGESTAQPMDLTDTHAKPVRAPIVSLDADDLVIAAPTLPTPEQTAVKP